tara:strand:+ start:1973 stop:2440 length:468 start_codon:yes stop_codon:yes gene_type:complete
MLTANTLFNSTRIMSIGGKEIGNGGTGSMNIPKNVRVKMEKNNVTEDEYLSLLVFAKHLPRGKQQLKLNYKELRNQLISDHQEKKSALTATSGLRKGGKVSTNGIKALTLPDHILNIKNKNRRPTFPINNVPYPYFKNDFTLGSRKTPNVNVLLK